jgi:hypothetical protein
MMPVIYADTVKGFRHQGRADAGGGLGRFASHRFYDLLDLHGVICSKWADKLI